VVVNIVVSSRGGRVCYLGTSFDDTEQTVAVQEALPD
jgi:hypothetical protein